MIMESRALFVKIGVSPVLDTNFRKIGGEMWVMVRRSW